MADSAITTKSAIVAAHPDDEVLWFSSVLTNVGKVLICFQDVPSRPEWSAGRRRSLSAYPRKNVTGLGLTESEVFDGAAWPDPEIAEYGLKVSRTTGSLPGFSLKRYADNFERLKDELRPRLKGCRNVFTHNPWGEYGHEEHVQVFRAVDALRTEAGFRMWISNYYSNKSSGLMLRYLAVLNGEIRTLKTRPTLGKRLQKLYSRHDCWTWFSDYRWPETEVFVSWDDGADAVPRVGAVFPMNVVRLEPPAKVDVGPSWRTLPGRAWRKARSVIHNAHFIDRLGKADGHEHPRLPWIKRFL